MSAIRTAFTALLLSLLSGCMQATPDLPEKEVEVVKTNKATEAVPLETEPVSQQEIVEAALYGKIQTIEAALKQGYKPDTRDPENRTVLMYAAFNGQTDIAKLLIDAGADVNAQDNIGTSSLMFAASGPSTDAVQLLLDSGAKINMIDSNEHFTALMWAAAEGQVENVKLLIENKADANLMDIDGDTAESFAAQKGHTAIAAMLKEYAAKE